MHNFPDDDDEETMTNTQVLQTLPDVFADPRGKTFSCPIHKYMYVQG
jgi:hypothetical protein